MKFMKRAISAVLASVVLLGMSTVSYASGAKSAADAVSLSGDNIIAETGTTVVKTDSNWKVTEAMTAEDTTMEFSMKALLPRAGSYILTIVSDSGVDVAVNGTALTLPEPTNDDTLKKYVMGGVNFNAGTNEIKFSVNGTVGETAEFILKSVTIAHPTLKVRGQEYSKQTHGTPGTRTYETGNGNINYYSYASKDNPFYAEYQFYVPEDGKYSLSGYMSFPEGSRNGDSNYYSQCKITWDGFKGSYDVIDTPIASEFKQFGTSTYSDIMLKKGIHTLRITPIKATKNSKYNLNVGDLALTKTGDYQESVKMIEIMGNEYTSAGGMNVTAKNDIKLSSTGEAISHWQFKKSGMTAGDTDTVTYSFDVAKAGWYSFEGWINSDGSQWVSKNDIKVDGTKLNVTENAKLTESVSKSTERFHIAKKTTSGKKIWLDEGTHSLAIVFSPKTNNNAEINARIWKLIFTLVSDGDVCIPAENFEGESAINMTVATTTFGGAEIEYASFKNDNWTEDDGDFTLTYKFTPEFTGKYTFDGWASIDTRYVSMPYFMLGDDIIDTLEDTDVKTADNLVGRHTANGIELTEGQEYTLTVGFVPKESDKKMNAKLWKMVFTMEDGEGSGAKEKDITKEMKNNTLTGSLYVGAQETKTTGYVIYAQYGNNKLENAIAEKIELLPSSLFSTATFGIELPAGHDGEDKTEKLFVITPEACTLFNVLELN